jgi:NAD(P)-dependent dehydrogenase (short-subunit alcohol dehydrogenase family)
MSSESPVYLVLGASGAVGSALVTKLHEAGYRVAAGVRDQSAADTAGESVHVFDAREPESIEEAVAAAAAEHGRLDGIANCVGSILLKAAHQTRYEEWDETILLNLTSCFAVLRAAPKAFGKGGGAVAFVSTAAAETGLPSHEAIAAAKAGVCGLTRSAAATYASRGIRVNAVAPGLVESKMSAPIIQSEVSRKASESMIPLGRIGQPEEVASALAWFLDPAQSWVTGQVLGVDGGLASARPRPRA